DDVRVVRNHGLAGMARQREQMEQRIAGRIERFELARRQPADGANLGDAAAAANRRDAVAHRAARGVVGGTESLFGCLDFEEILEAEAELFEFARTEAGQGVA